MFDTFGGFKNITTFAVTIKTKQIWDSITNQWF
jgi:hypothetical protein